MQHLGPERRTDELAVRRVRNRLEHLRNSRPVLCVQVGIDFVKQVERCRIAGLDGEDECQSTKT